MIITEEYLDKAFDKYNIKMFDNKLPRPRLRLAKSKTKLGRMQCRQTWMGKWWTKDYTIYVSTYYDMSSTQFDDILIHEMIHYAISYLGLVDTSAHGTVFKAMMETINRKFRRNITVTMKTEGLVPRNAMGRKDYLVLGVTTKNGSHFLSSVNPSAVKKIETQLQTATEIKSYDWFSSKDDFFQNMPRVRSLRGIRVDELRFKEMIRKMRLLTSPFLLT